MSQQPKLAKVFLDGLRQVLGPATQPIALHEPEFGGNEWKYVKECIDTGWVSSVGKYVDEFERRLAESTGTAHAVAVVNGTAALHIALHLAGVNPGEEVLIPALSFVATANSVSHCYALPHFVDSSAATLGMDPEALASHLSKIAERTSGGWRNSTTGRRLAAIVPMHTFGHPVDLPRVMDVASRFNLPVVEDATESLGSTCRGRHAGSFGAMGVLSFNGNKVVTTGGGGAIVTSDAVLARQAKHLTTTAKQPHRWGFFHDAVAYNYRLPNINAALGCAQLEQLPHFVIRKRQLAERYMKVFAGMHGLSVVTETEGCYSNYWLNAVQLNVPDMAMRDSLLGVANDAGYQCRPVWTLLHKLPMYRECPRAALPVAEALEASLINLPSSAKLAQIQA